jgi:putative aminophosphonate oxidoreductase
MSSLLTTMSTTGPRELTHRSLWLQEVLPAEPPELAARTPLSGRLRADVAILGGGYTGLWTALFLKEREPGLDVAIVEADLCGGGASGRNGGFALSWWSKLATLVKLCGEEEGVWLAEQAEDAVRHVGTFCAEHEIDCDFVHAGWLWVATSTAQVDTWGSTVEECERRGRTVFVPVTPGDAQARGGSKSYLGGIFDPTAARVQPAALARGLRRVALERGVRIFEDSRVVAIDGTRPLVVRTAAGSLQAETVVSALNAWTTGLPQLHRLRRAIVTLSSDVVATAPRPDLLAATGWTGGELVSDSRLMVHYHRATRDGRIVLGKGGGQIAPAGVFGDSFHYSRRLCDAATEALRRLYPEFAGIDVTHAWSGPIDRTTTGLPCFGRAEGNERLLYAVGFSGNGVAPCVTGGRILSSLVLGADDRWASCGLARGPKQLFPPEPIRYVGGLVVREAVRRKEAYEDAGRAVPGVLSFLAGLAPAGYFKVGPKRAGAPAAEREPAARA